MKVPEVEARKLLDFLSITTLPTPLQTICEYLNINLIFLRHEALTDAMYTQGRNGPVIASTTLSTSTESVFHLLTSWVIINLDMVRYHSNQI